MDVEMQGLLDAMRGVSVEEIYGFKFYARSGCFMSIKPIWYTGW